MTTRSSLRPATLAIVLWLAACGGGSSGGGSAGGNPPPPPPPPPPTVDPEYRVSGPSPFGANCDGQPATGTAFVNAEVEPDLAVDPNDPQRMVGAWQQDRWSNGSARGIVVAYSRDGGVNWTRQPLPFTRCGGGNASNGGDYARGTDPWVTFAPDGVVHVMGLVTTGGSFAAGSVNAMLASRSLDGGRTWSAPATLIRDGSGFFNDKNAMTADPTDPDFVYATWDRLVASGGGPTYFTRTTDSGATWETARAIYDPGSSSQTIGNVVEVTPDGTLVNVFTQLDTVNNMQSAWVGVLLSVDRGASWSPPVRIADLLAVGASDPDTGTPVRDGSLLAQIASDPRNGNLYVVWQDARFSGGTVDGIALSRSTDGGLTWSAPARVNNTAVNVHAFTPRVHVRGDGRVGVTYYDLRANTADPNALQTEYWLAQSRDGGNTWSETRIANVFDLDTAPNAGGYFLGDYQGLGSRNDVFVPFYVRTNSGDANNRTDVFAAPQVSAVAALASRPAFSRAAERGATPLRVDAGWRLRTHQNISRYRSSRLVGETRETRRPVERREGPRRQAF